MIDFKKQYQTRDGNKVVLWPRLRQGHRNPVVGVVMVEGEEYIASWDLDGREFSGDSHCDLVEVRPKRYVNVYAPELYETRAEADKVACNGRVACLEFREGDGLE